MISFRSFLDIPIAPHYEQQMKWEVEVTRPVLSTNHKVVQFCLEGGCGSQEYVPAKEISWVALEAQRLLHEQRKDWVQSPAFVYDNYFEKKGMVREK